MNRRDLNVIRKTAEGIRLALSLLRSAEKEACLSAALEALDGPRVRPLTADLIGFYAAMLLASENSKLLP